VWKGYIYIYLYYTLITSPYTMASTKDKKHNVRIFAARILALRACHIRCSGVCRPVRPNAAEGVAQRTVRAVPDRQHFTGGTQINSSHIDGSRRRLHRDLAPHTFSGCGLVLPHERTSQSPVHQFAPRTKPRRLSVLD
jgi:hypothetical protein